MSSVLEQLRPEPYIWLTTFRKSGKAVGTPIWFTSDDSRLYVWTPRDSGKVKRIRAGSPVEVVACDFGGKNTHGPTFAGTARLLDEGDSERVRKMIISKYGVAGFFSIYGSILRGGRKRTIGVEITLDG
jgi:PPOX class probable F420-dependent enzyme